MQINFFSGFDEKLYYLDQKIAWKLQHVSSSEVNATGLFVIYFTGLKLIWKEKLKLLSTLSVIVFSYEAFDFAVKLFIVNVNVRRPNTTIQSHLFLLQTGPLHSSHFRGKVATWQTRMSDSSINPHFLFYQNLYAQVMLWLFEELSLINLVSSHILQFQFYLCDISTAFFFRIL